MKTIRTRIVFSILLPVTLVAAIIGGISAYMNFNSTFTTLKQTLSEAVNIAANQVASGIEVYRTLATEFAQNGTLVGVNPTDVKVRELDRLAATHGLVSVELLDKNGVSARDRADYSQYEFFSQAKGTNQIFVSDPMVVGEDLVIYIAAPIVRNGSFDGAVAIAADGAFISDIVANIRVGSGNAAILNQNGDTIGFEDTQLVRDRYNTQKEAQSDSKLKRLAEIEAAMTRGETGIGEYYYGGKEKLMAYRPIPQTNGWSIDIAIVRNEFMTGTQKSLVYTAVLFALAVVVAMAVAYRSSATIAVPVKLCARRLEQLADGDLETPVPDIQNKDETGQLAHSAGKLVDQFKDVIEDIRWVLGEMADNNLTVDPRAEYRGDFAPIRDAVQNISQSLNHTLRDINVAADEVSSGSDQVAGGAQSLSQGATEQASAVEELAATIAEISSQVQVTASNAKEADAQSRTAGQQVGACNDKMQDMIHAMEAISESSGEIGKIIKTIEDIAFQTNILALNAAVEAARAGEAGKGFAVVADEVRNLAGKSAEAAQNTTSLIEQAIQNVSIGTRIADDTAVSMMEVVECTTGMNATIDKISNAAGEQASSISQVTLGIDQIASVVQTNSATAEESAAASEQLSSQAATMKSLVGKFRLKDDVGGRVLY